MTMPDCFMNTGGCEGYLEMETRLVHKIAKLEQAIQEIKTALTNDTIKMSLRWQAALDIIHAMESL